jgi:hypothetical protein
MEKIFRKPLRFTAIVTLCLVVFITGSCDKSETPAVTSNIDNNPVADLPWLKEKTNNLLAQNRNVAIYQFEYDTGKIGFWEDYSDIAYFYNYEGEILCTVGEGERDTCVGLNIDFENKELIWEMNYWTEAACIPKEESSIWQYSGPDSVVIKLTFYPLKNKVHIIGTEKSGIPSLLGDNDVLELDYRITSDNKFYLSHSDYEIFNNVILYIDCISEKEFVLRNGGAMLLVALPPYMSEAHFIRQTD